MEYRMPPDSKIPRLASSKSSAPLTEKHPNLYLNNSLPGKKVRSPRRVVSDNYEHYKESSIPVPKTSLSTSRLSSRNFSVPSYQSDLTRTPDSKKRPSTFLSASSSGSSSPASSSSSMTNSTDIELNKLMFAKKLESDKLSKDCEIRANELNEIKQNVMKFMTLKQKNELAHEKLKDKKSQLMNEINDFQESIKFFEETASQKFAKLHDQYDLEIQQLQLNLNTEMSKLQQNFEYHKTNLKLDKIKELTKEKEVIARENSELEDRLRNIKKELESEIVSLTRSNESKLGKLEEEYTTEYNKLIKVKQSADSDTLMTKNEISKIEHDLRNDTIKESQISIQLAKYMNQNKALADVGSQLKNEVSELHKEYELKMKRIEFIKQYVAHSSERDSTLKSQLMTEEAHRRKLHSTLQELKGNIRVFCRVRPPQDVKKSCTMDFPDQHTDSSEIVIKNENQYGPSKFEFAFDRVFQPFCSNSDIFEEISQLVQTALDGHNVCVFAYGQTGSGKTYTMSSPNDGMIPSAINQIFAQKEQLKEKGWSYKILGQFLEIYNETVQDLLNVSANSKKLEIRHQGTKTNVSNVIELELKSPKMVSEVLKRVNDNKSVASTKANERSSRSHTVYRIILQGVNKVTKESCEGVLNLIDLAGSERLSHSQVTGNRLKETQAINKSLSSLGDVIAALGSNQANGHVPFRNSKLTYLLQNSLTGTSKTLMFINISPDISHFNETLNSLRFAAKVNSTKIGSKKSTKA